MEMQVILSKNDARQLVPILEDKMAQMEKKYRKDALKTAKEMDDHWEDCMPTPYDFIVHMLRELKL